MSLSKHSSLLVCMAFCLVMAGCLRRIVYSHYEHTPLSGWETADSLLFDVGPIYSDGLYEETVGLRINTAYPFMSLTLIVDQHVLPAGFHHIDTLHASLIDRDGTIQGQGISYFQYNFRLRQLRFNVGDSLHLSIRHNMKRDMLPGISDVGFVVRRLD